jgi:hypothetical protein
MKVLFAGPSLYGIYPDLSGIDNRGPAVQGDIARAVLDGANAIGVVDGNFEAIASVWHKEILFALALGVTVLGSSSMGALRAAECAPYGMRPIGVIANAYASGALDDDAAVALAHGPAELGYPPVTEPLVDVDPTLRRLRALSILDNRAYEGVWEGAQRIFFKDRTDEAMFTGAHADKLDAYRAHRINQKADDALLLIAELRSCLDCRVERPEVASIPSFFSRQILPELIAAKAA